MIDEQLAEGGTMIDGKPNTEMDPMVVARASGLELLVGQFPEDVAAAAQAAAEDRDDMPELDDCLQEPWPAMRPRSPR